jgi:hypothetical protein
LVNHRETTGRNWRSCARRRGAFLAVLSILNGLSIDVRSSGKDTNAFYPGEICHLSDARVPSWSEVRAILNYTGIVRETKDFDLFIRHVDLTSPCTLRDAGYDTEITFPHWLAKARRSNDVVDLVFSSAAALCRVDDVVRPPSGPTSSACP